jgi:hypothetical protein
MSGLFDVNDSDELWVVKNFFSEHDGVLFPSCIAHILSGIGYGNEYAMCTFPDSIEPDEEPFNGIRFTMYGGHTKVIDEDAFKKITIEACRRYILKNSSRRNQITEILSRHGLNIES